MTNTLDEVQTILRDLFDDEELVVSPETTASDVDGWDSLMHLNIVIAVENHFGIRFATAEISSLKNEGQNLGNFLELIDAKR